MKSDGVLNILNVFIALFAMLSSVVMGSIALRTYERGTIPEKSLTSGGFGGLDSLSALRGAGEAITVAVNAGGTPLHNLFVSTVTLKNIGQAPILPTDIYGKITLKVPAPWRIITVTKGALGDLAFDWRKVSDTEFQAEPALINPGDVLWATVYMTYASDAALPPDEPLSPSLEWSARISNLRTIVPEPENTEGPFGSGSLVVFISGWAVWVILFSFLVYSGLYLQLLYLNKFLSPWRIQSFALVLAAGLISLVAAEAGSTYIVGPTLLVPTNHLLNAPWLILNVAALGTLYLMWRRGRRNGAGKVSLSLE